MAPKRWARRFGYTLAALINLAILYVINVFPGWDAVPFLTAATPQVLVLFNVSLLAGIVANAVYVVTDGPWVKALGELTTTTIGLAVLIAQTVMLTRLAVERLGHPGGHALR